MSTKWFVQARGEDGLFRTVENGEHDYLSTAGWHYTALCATPGVHMLLRGSHIVLRSDDVELADKPADAML